MLRIKRAVSMVLALSFLAMNIINGCSNNSRITSVTEGKEAVGGIVAPSTERTDGSKAEGLIVDDPNIRFEGALEIERSPEAIKLRRFTSDILKKPQEDFSTENADTTSGITMHFKTSSKKITACFTALPYTTEKNRGAEFAVFKDNKLYKEYKFPNAVTNISFEIVSEGDNPVTYAITFPSWANVVFKGLKLDPGKSLEKMSEVTKLKYAAIGDSITHGVDRGSATNKTYPYILAGKFGWEVYNLGVGGSRVAPEVGNMISAKRFDIITILIGYNDWNTKNNTITYESDLSLLISNIRKSQPNCRIFCITPTTSTTQMKGRKTKTLDDYRNSVKEVVARLAEKGDKNIFVINGDEITTENDLVDGVHLNSAGAVNFADKLYEKISKILDSLPE